MDKFIKTTALFIGLTATLPVFADSFYDKIKFVNPVEPNVSVQYNPVASQPKKVTLTQNSVRNQYAIAFDRFMQSNVKAAYNDYNMLIETMNPNDYAYMTMAEKMAEIGFFDLSRAAFSKISDKEYSYLLVDDIQRYYFPSKNLKREDQTYLAEVFSNITYNDQSREATAELVKNTTLLTNSDYANYIAALGFLKSNNITEADKYIDAAILMNKENLNYKKLKAEILAQNKKTKEALLIVENLKKQSLYSTGFNNKINSLEQYILYRISKKEADKTYHLGYYYYYEKEFAKSARTLQSLTANKKKSSKEVFALLSRVYFDMNEFEKSQDNAQKALKAGSDAIALEVMGDLSNRQKDYKNALKYYKSAADKNKKSPQTLVKVARVYQSMGIQKKALEIYAKILKSYANCYIAYYETALADKSKEIAYLKKSVAVNKDFKDGWLDLARVEIEHHNFDDAKQYLATANYIDENDFRYYYYQGLIFKAQGMKDEANHYFKKSLHINPEYAPVKKELNI